MTDANALSTVQPALQPGEQLLWAGRPGQGLRLSSGDAFLIPFSVMWGGFAIFWEATALRNNAPFFFMLWGIPFVAIGLYLIVGRFFWDAYMRAKQVYAVTSQRLIVMRGGNVNSSALLNLPQLNLATSASGQGSIDFGQPGYGQYGYGNQGWGLWAPSTNSTRFVLLDDAQQVFQIIQKAQREARQPR